jgi:hypothetical protein
MNDENCEVKTLKECRKARKEDICEMEDFCMLLGEKLLEGEW